MKNRFAAWGACVIIAFAFSMPLKSWAEDDASYAHIRAIGSVTLDGNSVTEEDIGKDGVEIRTEKESYAQIEILSTSSHLTVSPNSTFVLHRPKKNGDEMHLLRGGAVRSKVNRRPERGFKILTAPAVFGVRGTDFVVMVEPLFNDAELIVLQGSVEEVSTSDPMDTKVIQAGEWSGIGGRFGKKTTEALKLPSDAVKALESRYSAPKWVSFPKRGKSAN